MFKYLPSNGIYNALIDAIDNGAPLDRSIADEVAAGMKKWASRNGCSLIILTGLHRSPKVRQKSMTLSSNMTAREA